jgi:hypothetical protein
MYRLRGHDLPGAGPREVLLHAAHQGATYDRAALAFLLADRLTHPRLRHVRQSRGPAETKFFGQVKKV